MYIYNMNISMRIITVNSQFWVTYAGKIQSLRSYVNLTFVQYDWFYGLRPSSRILNKL
jgi:hypothetical protein